MALVTGPLVSADIITFKNGQDGYSGCVDGAARSEPGREVYNYGTSTSFTSNFEDESNQEFVSFIQFEDLFGAGSNQISAGQTITDAKLYLYARGMQNAGTSRMVNAYAMLVGVNMGTKNSQPADDGEVCWDARARNQVAWGGDMHNGPVSGMDYTLNHADRTAVSAVGWVSWNVTDMVNDWYSNALANHGILIRGGESTLQRRIDYCSTDWTTTGKMGDPLDPTYFPYLEVTYVPEPVSLILLSLGGLVLAGRRNS